MAKTKAYLTDLTVREMKPLFALKAFIGTMSPIMTFASRLAAHEVRTFVALRSVESKSPSSIYPRVPFCFVLSVFMVKGLTLSVTRSITHHQNSSSQVT